MVRKSHWFKLLNLSIVFFSLIIGLLFIKRQQQPDEERETLRILVYSSFMSDWGPGPKIKRLMETHCNCRILFIDGDDSRVLLSKAELQSEALKLDMVLGIDHYDLEDAESKLKFKKIQLNTTTFHPFIKNSSTSELLIPFDWGILAFNSRTDLKGDELTSLNGLLNPQFKNNIALQNPHLSSPGLQFLIWVLNAFGETKGKEFLIQLKPQIHSISPSWSSSYHLFQKNSVKLVFSYVTSPLYHQIYENDFSFQALAFKEKHPAQIEYMGVLQSCQSCELAEEFTKFILSAESQKIIMEKNLMFPVNEEVLRDSLFFKSSEFNKFLILNPKDKKRWLAIWDEVMRK